MHVLLALLACSAPPADHPTVVWITVDTLRADHLGFLGHEQAHTPNLDALAARGRVFPNATTPLPRTTQALATALTGRLPEAHGSLEVGDPIGDVPTLAQALHDRGWHTIGRSAMQVAGPEQHLDRGFDAFAVHHDAPAAHMVEHALDALRGAPPGPRFLWLHLADPHFPYLPDGATGPCAELGTRAASGQARRVDWFANMEGRSAALLDDCTALYDAEIAQVDAALGPLLDALPNALVVFSADHGEHLGEQGIYFEHGPTVHPADLNIPLVVAGPGIAPGRDERLAQLQDLAPTTLAHLGLPAMESDGLDLLAEPARTTAAARSGSALQARLTSVLVAGRGKRWCLHGPRWSRCTTGKGAALHDRDTDAALGADVAHAHPAVAATMAEHASHWAPEGAREYVVFDADHALVARPRLEGGYRTALYRRDDPVRSVPVDDPAAVERLRPLLPDAVPVRDDTRTAEELERLRALGYVE